MYVGRIVAVGRTKSDKLAAMYRVSSRSFPNRQAEKIGQAVAIVPKAGFEGDIRKNPYITYNCLRLVKEFAVLTNGSQTDPIAEKLESGMRVRDALVLTLLGLDYEHDQLNTPRIAAVVDRGSRRCALGIVRADALLVREFALAPGEARYVATYEHNSPDEAYRDGAFDVQDAAGACGYILGRGVFAGLEKPVTAVCALEKDSGFETAFQDAAPPAAA
jgi:IMP cyclohydrolase